MTRPLKLSVALCTYNGEKYLEEQLKSIVEQHYAPFEIVICDDGSKDGTLKIIERFQGKCHIPVRVYINEHNLGSTKNFEKAILLCKGDIVALSDQDDIWHPEKLKKSVEVFQENESVGAVFTDAHIVDERLVHLGCRLWDSIGFTAKERRLIKEGHAVSVLLKHSVVTGATMTFRREFIPYVTPISRYWVHDQWIALIIACISNLSCIDEPLLHYRQHASQQIGALKIDWREYFGMIVRDNSDKYNIEIQRYRLILEKLLNIRGNGVERRSLAQIQDKIMHMSFRANLPKKKIHRAANATKELFQLRYHRYSNGFLSLAKDMVLGQRPAYKG